jgi:ribosomal-protein-alanine N-acetyltransferase
MGTIEIRTERLLLRKYRISDGEILYQNIGSDDELSKYTQWNPYRTYEMSRETVERFIKQYEDQHFYGWLIEADGWLAS